MTEYERGRHDGYQLGLRVGASRMRRNVETLLKVWDRITKGESPTTKAVREAMDHDSPGCDPL